MEVNARTRDEAVKKLQQMMNQSAIAEHFREKHPGEEVPSVDQVHAMISENLMTVSV